MQVQKVEAPIFPHSSTVKIGLGEVHYSGWFMAWLEVGSRGCGDSGRVLAAVRCAKYTAAGYTQITFHLNMGPHKPLMIMTKEEASASLTAIRESDGSLVYETNQEQLNERWLRELAGKYTLNN